MTTTRPEPWHRVVRLKDELRSGELTLAEFAADLHEVTLGQGTRPVYEDPARFFALTFPHHRPAGTRSRTWRNDSQERAPRRYGNWS